jgi:nucleoid-associated protein YgaU
MSSSATLDRPSVTMDRQTTIRSAARPGRPVPATVPARAGLRLTRRGRLTVVLLIALLALVVTLVGAASVSAVTSAPAAGSTSTVVVQPGQTLWELAEQVAPDRDPREVIKAISDANALTTALVAPGQSLVIPSF